MVVPALIPAKSFALRVVVADVRPPGADMNNPVDPIVVTVGSIHGGTKHNIIPDEVKMQLTVRSYKADVRERVLAAIERIAKGTATAAGWPAGASLPEVIVRKDEFTPATYNNPELTKRLVAVWKKELGPDRVEPINPTMGGEDFSEFSLPDNSSRQRLAPRPGWGRRNSTGERKPEIAPSSRRASLPQCRSQPSAPA